MRYLFAAIVCWLVCVFAIANAESLYLFMEKNKTTVVDKEAGDYQAYVIGNKVIKEPLDKCTVDGKDVILFQASSIEEKAELMQDASFIDNTFLGLILKHPEAADKLLDYEPIDPPLDKNGDPIKRGSVESFRDKDGNLPPGVVKIRRQLSGRPLSTSFNSDGSFKDKE